TATGSRVFRLPQNEFLNAARALTTRTNNKERKLKMKRSMKFLNIVTCVMVLLPASVAMAQQATPGSSPSMQMQRPSENPALPSASPQTNEQSAQPMQKMDKMADSVTTM